MLKVSAPSYHCPPFDVMLSISRSHDMEKVWDVKFYFKST